MNLSHTLPLFVDLMLKGVAVAGLAWLAARISRGASAANRHLIWLAGFGVLLVLPFTVAWLPREASPAGGSATVIVLKLPVTITAPLVAAPVAAAAAPTLGWRAATDWVCGHWRDELVRLWLGGAVVLLAWRLVGAARLRRLKRRSRRVQDARIETWTRRIATAQGIRRRVELRSSSACPVAMTWGTWRPVVMLPVDAPGWSEERLELVLRHELAHVARRDCLARLLSQVACALYWPNPLVWLGARRLRLAQEQACDDQVLAAGGAAEAYASELLAGAQALSAKGWGGAAVAMAEPSTLESRIVGIVDEARDRSVARRTTVTLATVAAVLALVAGAAVQVRAGQEPALRPAAKAKVYRQVEIEVRYMELKGGTTGDLKSFTDAAALRGETPEIIAYLAREQVESRLRELGKRAGTDLLSAPKVTVLEDNRASICVTQELRFPIAWARSEGSLPVVPKTFDARDVGVVTNVLPRVLADGSVELEIHGVVREFQGFVGSGLGANGVPVAPAHVYGSPASSALAMRFGLDRPLSGAAAGSQPEPVAEETEGAAQDPALADVAFMPIFGEREVTATARLRPGQTVVLQLGSRKTVVPSAPGDWALKAVPPDVADDSLVLAFVKATVLDLAAARLAQASPPPPPSGTTITEVPYDPALFQP